MKDLKQCCEKCLHSQGGDYCYIDSLCPCGKCECHQPKEVSEDWEKEAERLYFQTGITIDDWMNFVKDLLAKAREETLEEVVKGLKHIAMYHERGDEKSTKLEV